MSNNQNPLITPQMQPQNIHYRDEISLIDIWLTLRKHKKIMLWTFSAIVLTGVAVALLMPKKYEILTSLEIGTTIQGTQPVPIESPQTVQAKLQNSFIPALQYQLHSAEASAKPYDISIQIPKNSSLIVLKSKARESDEKKYKLFHSSLVAAVVKDHSKLLNVLKKNLSADIERAKIELNALEDEATLASKKQAIENPLAQAREELKKLTTPKIFGVEIQRAENDIHIEEKKLASLINEAEAIKAGLQRINTNQDLIRDEISGLEVYLENNRKLQKESTNKLKDENSAMTQLLIDNDIQQNQERLSDLKERLYITLEDQKSEAETRLDENIQQQALQKAQITQAKGMLEHLLETNKIDQAKVQATLSELEAKLAKVINDHTRLLSNQKQTIDELQSKLENFVETKAVVPPTQSIEPISTSKTAILLISIFLGLILMPIAAFFAELQQKVKATIVVEK